MNEAERNARNTAARDEWERDRIGRLRKFLAASIRSTLVFDVATPSEPFARVHGRLERVLSDTIEVTDMSDASQPPGSKPTRTIAIAAIRDARVP